LQWWVAMPSELFDWQVMYLDIYLFYVYGTAGPTATETEFNSSEVMAVS